MPAASGFSRTGSVKEAGGARGRWSKVQERGGPSRLLSAAPSTQQGARGLHRARRRRQNAPSRGYSIPAAPEPVPCTAEEWRGRAHAWVT